MASRRDPVAGVATGRNASQGRLKPIGVLIEALHAMSIRREDDAAAHEGCVRVWRLISPCVVVDRGGRYEFEIEASRSTNVGGACSIRSSVGRAAWSRGAADWIHWPQTTH